MDRKDTYYHPPIEWSYDSIVDWYLKINNEVSWQNTLSFDSIEGFTDIIRIKKALQMISFKLKEKDPGAVDICVSFVSSPVYFHYSGYIRATMARRLKSCKLSVKQKRVLTRGVEALIANKQTSHEFKEIKALYVKVVNDV